jgi:hypothetical protein
MARQIAIEEESGTCTGRWPEHNGYYAGDFSTVAPAFPPRAPRPSAATTTAVRSYGAGRGHDAGIDPWHLS